MTGLHDFLDYDNDYDNEHRFAGHEHERIVNVIGMYDATI